MMNDVEIKSIDQLMRDGIAAARQQDLQTAQARFAEVLSQDNTYELAWLWLASTVTDPADKRECFTSVLNINPDNAVAHRELAKLDAASAPHAGDQSLSPEAAAALPKYPTDVGPEVTSSSTAKPSDDQPLRASSIEVIGAETPGAEEKRPGALRQFLAPFQEIPLGTRRAAAGLLIALAVIFIALIVSGRAAPPNNQPTIAAASDGGSHTIAVMLQATDGPTVVASPTPTLTPTTFVVTQGVQFSTLAPVVLPPTWTPAATSTSSILPTNTPLPAPPANLPGKLAILSGSIATLDNFWPVIITAPDGSQPQAALTDPMRAEFVQLVPDGKQMIYVYTTQGVEALNMQTANRNGSSVRQVWDAWGNKPSLSNPHGTALSADGRLLAFAAQDFQEQTPAIYVLNVQSFLGLSSLPTNTPSPTPVGAPTDHVPPGVLIGTSTPLPTPILTATATPSLATQYLVHVTPANNGINNWPSLAPNNQFVAFTVDSTGSGENAVDLYVALVQPNSTPLRLTKDGGTLVKGASAWSPDSKQIAFTSTAKDNSFSDIELINSDGGSRQILIHQDKAHNFRPHWSPDGKYLAFTSDRTGKDQVFMLDMTSRQLYQITHDGNTNILSDWAAQ